MNFGTHGARIGGTGAARTCAGPAGRSRQAMEGTAVAEQIAEFMRPTE